MSEYKYLFRAYSPFFLKNYTSAHIRGMLTLAAPTLLFLTCGDDMVNTCHITLQIRENNALNSTATCTDDQC